MFTVLGCHATTPPQSWGGYFSNPVTKLLIGSTGLAKLRFRIAHASVGESLPDFNPRFTLPERSPPE